MGTTSNKTTATGQSVDDFIAGVANAEQRSDAETLRNLMTRATGEPATMWGPSIVGFGTFRYRYESGREGETCLVGFSPRSGKTALYLNLPGGLEAHGDALTRLGKHATGKGCLYVKRMRDIDERVLEELVLASVTASR